MPSDIHDVLSPPPSRWRSFAFLGGGIVGLLAVVGVGAWFLRPTPVRYDTSPLTRDTLTVTVEATGTLEAMETVEVGAEVSGKLSEVLVDYNSAVQVGQVLARIDPSQLQASVDQARAQLSQSEASLMEARASAAEAAAAWARAKEEAALGLVSTAELEAKEAAAARAKASVQSATASATVARANLTAAEDKLEKAIIVSPLDGFVLSREVSQGQTVTAGFSTPVLFTLAKDLQTMRLIVDVDEADIGVVKEGQAATFRVDAFTGASFPTTVSQLRFAPTTTQNVVTYEAVLSVENPEHKLRPGMTATATVEVARQEGAWIVPSEALEFTPEGEEKAKTPRIYVQDGAGVRAVAVQTGLSDETHTAITFADGALQEGDAVVLGVMGAAASSAKASSEDEGGGLGGPPPGGM